MRPICNLQIKAEKPEYRSFPPNTDRSLGACLKRKRLNSKLTQFDCATLFGVLKDSYQKWEWNQVVPDIKNQKRVCEFLEYNFWDDGTNSLASRVRLYRIEFGIYRTDLAKLIGVSDSTIERIEKNTGQVSTGLLNTVKEFISDYLK